jgi:hypothetical protein
MLREVSLYDVDCWVKTSALALWVATLEVLPLGAISDKTQKPFSNVLLSVERTLDVMREVPQLSKNVLLKSQARSNLGGAGELSKLVELSLCRQLGSDWTRGCYRVGLHIMGNGVAS